ncbi:MAG: hypothetical protein L0H93_08140 [Nocardioides sp.]|nr:hypothetical protein [Nocardioides sp.]
MGDYLESSYWDGSAVVSYPDYGGTIDTNLALQAADSVSPIFSTEIADTAAWVRAHASDYTGSGSCVASSNPATTSLSAGATAKITVFELANLPTSTAGNYAAELACMQDGSGRIANYGTSAASPTWTFDQAFAILALDNVSGYGTETTDAVTYLLSQQCTNGAFAGAFPAGLGGNGTCNNTAFDPDQADVDSTALAIQVLIDEGSVPSLIAAFNANTWLSGQQNGAGYWQSTACTGTAQPSVNSTAVGIQAYVMIGSTVTTSQAWIENQAGIDARLPGCTATAGGTPVQDSFDQYATNQGVLGLLGVTYPSLV